MEYRIESIKSSDYKELIDIWEASVRATHHFLKEEDIEYFKILILNTYFDAVELRCVKNSNGKIVGFSGVSEQKLEMLFIHPNERRKGIGKALLHHAIEKQQVNVVDVNEQNEDATHFYLENGFKVFHRSELDSTGKAYPILHMKLDNI